MTIEEKVREIIRSKDLDSIKVANIMRIIEVDLNELEASDKFYRHSCKDCKRCDTTVANFHSNQGLCRTFNAVVNVSIPMYCSQFERQED